MKGLSKIAVWVIGLLTAIIAALVVVGMVAGWNREFDRGVSSTSSVVTQEILGALTLTMLGVVAIRLPAVARGARLGPTLGLLLIAMLLAIGWLIAFAVERAS